MQKKKTAHSIPLGLKKYPQGKKNVHITRDISREIRIFYKKKHEPIWYAISFIFVEEAQGRGMIWLEKTQVDSGGLFFLFDSMEQFVVRGWVDSWMLSFGNGDDDFRIVEHVPFFWRWLVVAYEKKIKKVISSCDLSVVEKKVLLTIYTLGSWFFPFPVIFQEHTSKMTPSGK